MFVREVVDKSHSGNRSVQSGEMEKHWTPSIGSICNVKQSTTELKASSSKGIIPKHRARQIGHEACGFLVIDHVLVP